MTLLDKICTVYDIVTLMARTTWRRQRVASIGHNMRHSIQQKGGTTMVIDADRESIDFGAFMFMSVTDLVHCAACGDFPTRNGPTITRLSGSNFFLGSFFSA